MACLTFWRIFKDLGWTKTCDPGPKIHNRFSILHARVPRRKLSYSLSGLPWPGCWYIGTGWAWRSTVGGVTRTPDGGTATGAGGGVLRTPDGGAKADACAISVGLGVCPSANDVSVSRLMPSARQDMPFFKSGSFSSEPMVPALSNK